MNKLDLIIQLRAYKLRAYFKIKQNVLNPDIPSKYSCSNLERKTVKELKKLYDQLEY